MQRLFSDSLHKELCVFVDDITAPVNSCAEGVAILETFFSRLRSSGLKLKPEKCKLFQKEIRVLGFIVSQDSIREDPQRTAAIRDLEFPENTRQLRSFLGACNFSKHFHQDFARVASPL
jgi:hypothetical protein